MTMDTYFRTWQIDGQGRISEIPLPEDEPRKEWDKDNIYSITPNYAGIFTKKITHFEIMIFNWKPRNPEAEKALASFIRSAIQQDFDAALIERSGGIDALIAGLEWAEWW